VQVGPAPSHAAEVRVDTAVVALAPASFTAQEAGSREAELFRSRIPWITDAWINQSASKHTRCAYRKDMKAFVSFLSSAVLSNAANIDVCPSGLERLDGPLRCLRGGACADCLEISTFISWCLIERGLNRTLRPSFHVVGWAKRLTLASRRGPFDDWSAR
jgi:hypothetical protein